MGISPLMRFREALWLSTLGRLLRRRAESMDAWHSSVTAHLPRGANLEKWGPVGEVVSLWLHTAQSRAEWTRQLIGRLERGQYRMADDH